MAAGVGDPEALPGPDPVHEVDQGGVILDHVVDRKASPRVAAKVVPNHVRNPVQGPKAVTLEINPSLDHQARRRTPSLGLGPVLDQSPGIKAVPEV